MEYITSCRPDRIQTIRMIVLPSLQEDGVSLQRPDQCFLCRELIVPGQGYHYKVIEDPSQSPALDIQALEDHLHYIPTYTETPPMRNKSVQPCHNECGGGVARWQHSALRRTILPEWVESDIHAQGNTTVEDYKQMYHRDKLYICSSYYDVESLLIHAFSKDPTEQEQEKKEKECMTSYVMVMPTDIAHVLDVRPLAWLPEHVYGLFQQVVVLEMAWNDTIPPRHITTKVKQWCQSCFKDPGIETVVYMHRAIDDIDRSRIVIYARITQELFQRTIARFFQRTFLHMDTLCPRIMSWQQLFHPDILPIRSPLSNPGETTLETARRIEEWQTRRSSLHLKLERMIHPFIQLHDTDLLQPIQVISNGYINQYTEHTDITAYQVNSQRIEGHAYTFSSSASPCSLSCWKPDHTKSPSYIPYLTDAHKDDMQLLGVIEQPLESKVMLYSSMSS